MQLVQHLGLKRAGHAKAVAARAEAVEEPVPPGEEDAEGVSGPAPGREACACASAARGPRTGSEGSAARIAAAKSACRKRGDSADWAAATNAEAAPDAVNSSSAESGSA